MKTHTEINSIAIYHVCVYIFISELNQSHIYKCRIISLVLKMNSRIFLSVEVCKVLQSNLLPQTPVTFKPLDHMTLGRAIS